MWQTRCCLIQLGLSRKAVKYATKAAADAALRSSFWIFVNRDREAWGANSEVQMSRKKRQGSKKLREVTKSALVSTGMSLDTVGTSCSTFTVPLTNSVSTVKAANLSPMVSEFVGLRNIGNTCYMNAGLQVLLHVLRGVTVGVSTVGKALAGLREEMAKARKGVSPASFWRTFTMKVDRYSERVPHDASLFMIDLIDCIGGSCAAGQVRGTLDVAFRCSACAFQDPAGVQECFSNQYVPVAGVVTGGIERALKEAWGDQIVDRNALCPACNARSWLRCVSVVKFPAILCVSLRRFDWTDGGSVKIRDKVDTPLQDISITGMRYSLRGVLIHTGSFDSGHYFAIVKSAHWMMLDDLEVYYLNRFEAERHAQSGFVFVYEMVS